MIQITRQVKIPEDEIDISPIKSQGPGGQNVNKVSSAIHLRFDISGSSLPDIYKRRILRTKDRRINKNGVIVIKAQQCRSQEKNKELAIKKLVDLVKDSITVRKKRIATQPSPKSRLARLDKKSKRGSLKKMRKKIIDPEE